MKTRFALPVLALLAAPLTAQTIDTVGGTGSAPSRANIAKANLFQVDSTVLLTEIEMYLDVPTNDTITWFVYRHHSRDGDAAQLFTIPSTVTGGTGPGWYSSGFISVPMVCGNHYLIGAAWTSTVTYHYSIASPGDPVSFGNWQRARTPTVPLAPTISITGNDAAQYYQRLTTIGLNSVACGPVANCSGATLAPRLVADNAPLIGQNFGLDIVGVQPNSLVLCALADGPPLGAPQPLLGCSVYLDLNAAVFTLTAFADGTGLASIPLSVPNNSALVGLQQAVQAAGVGSTIDMTNVLGLTVN